MTKQPKPPGGDRPRRRTGRPPKTAAEKAETQRRRRSPRTEDRRRLREMAARARADAGPPDEELDAERAFTPTRNQRRQVQTMAGIPLRHEEIALLVINPATDEPIDEKTLRAHFKRELALGPVRRKERVSKALVAKACGNGPQAVTAAIFYLKCQAGWRETVGVDLSVRGGVLVAPAAQSPDEWIRANTANGGATSD